MRYYPLFRGAIPHSRVGYPRVTHPFAARLMAEAMASLDLHVLGAPPAFILSQDQTLRFEPARPARAGRVIRRYVSCYPSPARQDAVAPHARFSFQRTPTRLARRTINIGQRSPAVNPLSLPATALQRSSPLHGGERTLYPTRLALSTPHASADGGGVAQRACGDCLPTKLASRSRASLPSSPKRSAMPSWPPREPMPCRTTVPSPRNR